MTLLVRAIRQRVLGVTEPPHIMRPLDNSRRHSMVERPTHATLERQRIVNQQLVSSAVINIRLNERRLFLLEIEKEQLTKDNVALRAQVTDLTAVLEQRWLLRAEAVAQAVSALFHKFETLHQILSAQTAEAEKTQQIEQGCLMNNGKDWNRNVLREKLGPEYTYRSGIAYEINRWWTTYSCLYRKEEIFDPLEQLNQTFGENLKSAIHAKIDTLRDGVLPPETSILQPVSTEIATLQSTTEIDILHGTIEEQTQTRETLEDHNRHLHEENAKLEQRKNDVMKAQFTDYFRSELSPPCLRNLHSSALTVIRKCQDNIKDHPRLLAELDPWDQAHSRKGASYHTGLELAQQISPALDEMIQLIVKIQKGCPIPTT